MQFHNLPTDAHDLKKIINKYMQKYKIKLHVLTQHDIQYIELN